MERPDDLTLLKGRQVIATRDLICVHHDRRRTKDELRFGAETRLSAGTKLKVDERWPDVVEIGLCPRLLAGCTALSSQNLIYHLPWEAIELA